jgi:PAS domain S-box-containing protein
MVGHAPPGKALDPTRTLDAVRQAVIVTDGRGTVQFWNAAAEALYGWRADEVVGRSIVEVTPAEHLVDEAEEVMRQLRAGRTWSGDMVLRRKNGETFVAHVSDTPVLDATGEVVGIIGVSEDVTDRRQADAALAATAQRLQLALSAGRLGVWQWDRVTGEVEWDARVEEIYGVGPEGAPKTFEEYSALIHPDDREAATATVRAAVEAGTDYTVEHRVTTHDGRVRWVQGHGQPLWENGTVRGLVGVARDVTERHRAVERLQLLTDVTERLTTLPSASARIEALVDAVVPRLADACAVHLVQPDGTVAQVQFRHIDPHWEEVAREFVDRYPVRLDAPTGAGAAIREGTTSWSPEITDEMLVAAAQDGEHLELLRALAISGVVAVPLRGRDGVIGAVSFVTVDGRKIDDDDLGVAEDLCARAGLLIENARLLEERSASAAAHRYQAALLEAIHDSSIDGVIAVGPDGEVLSYNRRFLEIWGFDVAAIEAGDASLLEQARDRVADPDAFTTRVAEVYRERPAHVHDEVVLADGRTLERYGATIRARDGEYLGFAWTFRDVTADRLRQAEIAAAGERFAALARTLQQSLLPPLLPSPVGIELAARYHPALDGIEVGGDFYDVFAVDDDWILVLGDVCGKGAQAAALTALIRYSIRAVAMQDRDPAAILRELNSVMLHNVDDEDDARFATVCCLRLRRTDEGVATAIACAGHPPPMVVRRDGTIADLGVPGTIVGVFDDIDVTTTSEFLRPGDAVVTVTDGVLEARDADGEEFERTNLAQVLSEACAGDAAALANAVEAASLDWEGGRAHDDIAVLVAKVRNEGEPTT